MGWLILARGKRQFQGMRDENDKAPQMSKYRTFSEVVFKENSLSMGMGSPAGSSKLAIRFCN